MRAVIEKGRAAGSVTAPPSKSVAHRLLICAAMADGTSVIKNIPDCDDVAATVDCLRAMGVECSLTGTTATVRGIDFSVATASSPLNCRESASTLRFLIPVCLLSSKDIMLTADASLLRRPMDVYKKLSREKRFAFTRNKEGITVRGPLPSGEYRMDGNVSSQFTSGLLLALPRCASHSVVVLEKPVVSKPYIDLTLDALSSFGVRVERRWENALFIQGNQQFNAVQTQVEGDYSAAAFFEAFNYLGGSVKVGGLRNDSLQGDRVFRDCFERLHSGTATVDITDCPDLAPILFALAAANNGGEFTGTARLKYKESDRCEAMATELRKFGIKIAVGEDNVTVRQSPLRTPGETLYGHGDHRIVMALSVLLTLTGGTLCGAQAVSKSYPDFFDDLCAVGIKVSLSDGE